MNAALVRNNLGTRRVMCIAGAAAAGGGGVLALASWLADWKELFWIGLLAIAIGAIWLLCAWRIDDEPMRAAERRYLRTFFPAIIAYVLITLGIWPLAGQVHSGTAKALIALLPVIPMAFVVRAVVRQVLASDELQRRVQLEAILIASMSVSLLSFGAGFLQAAGLLHFKGGLMLVLPMLFAVYGVAAWWVRRRYRGE